MDCMLIERNCKHIGCVANIVCVAANDTSTLSVADLPLILALSRERTLAGAAEKLGIDLSTVFRRLNALETRLHVRLFDRSPRGYRLTSAGERAAASAERVESELLALDRDISGRDQQLSGVLRLTASETFSHAVLPGVLSAFQQVHPRIRLVLSIDNRTLDLSRREADVALRVQRPRDAALFGRRLTGIAFAYYGTPDTPALRRDGRSFNFSRHKVIGWDEQASLVVGNWVTAHVPPDRITFRCNSFVNQLMAVRAGLGIALLPCYLADRDAGVRRISGVVPELTSELWIVTHEDMKNTARIRAFLTHVGDAIVAARRSFEGVSS